MDRTQDTKNIYSISTSSSSPPPLALPLARALPVICAPLGLYRIIFLHLIVYYTDNMCTSPLVYVSENLHPPPLPSFPPPGLVPCILREQLLFPSVHHRGREKKTNCLQVCIYSICAWKTCTHEYAHKHARVRVRSPALALSLTHTLETRTHARAHTRS